MAAAQFLGHFSLSWKKGPFFHPEEERCVHLQLVKPLWTLLVYASSVSLTVQRGSWLGHDPGSVQSAAEALSAAEEQPLAFHKGERRRSGTGSLVSSRPWNIHKESYEGWKGNSLCWRCTPGLDAWRRRDSWVEGTKAKDAVILRLLSLIKTVLVQTAVDSPAGGRWIYLFIYFSFCCCCFCSASISFSLLIFSK